MFANASTTRTIRRDFEEKSNRREVVAEKGVRDGEAIDPRRERVHVTVRDARAVDESSIESVAKIRTGDARGVHRRERSRGIVQSRFPR